MRDIHISPTAQVVGVLGIAAAVGAAVTAQLPEIRRYLKVRNM